MNRKTTTIKNYERRELIVERIVAIPRTLAWQGWTKPVHIVRWWGPRNWTTTVYEMDVRPGGVWRYQLAADDGTNKVLCQAVYREVVEPSKLVYVDSMSDENWNVMNGSDMLTAVTFSDTVQGTKVSITTHFTSVEQLEGAEAMGMIEGYTDTLERLEEYWQLRESNSQ
ncbi:SRPBCC domain-containing protein [Paenibacillus agilis]|uniref:ATPase n=1 Tax=Paenibacillus agilis TaxID=3020863 RepID=A0A559IXT2_9BACL|nr:SRPBCC domain-containing protein [Paenibacillus agilis]TVX92438.1 ATPase [Paenibacillus agilis]